MHSGDPDTANAPAREMGRRRLFPVERLGVSEAVRPSSHRSLQSLVVIDVMEVIVRDG